SRNPPKRLIPARCRGGRSRNPPTLGGGGCQLLIMDEPSLGLSPLYVKQVMHAIRQVADIGFPVLLVEQNIKQVLQFSHRTYVLENGRLVLQGPSSELEGHPMIRKAYLGL